MFPPARVPYPFSHLSRLWGSGSAPSDEAEPGLALVAVAPPVAPALDLSDLVA